MIKVLVVDDQKILAEGVKTILETSTEIEVVNLAFDGEDALQKIEENKPDVVLLDIRMPKMDGVICTREIKKIHPEIKVVILTTFDDNEYIINAINYGASGYLLKDTNGDGLIQTVIDAFGGATILPSNIAQKIVTAAKMVGHEKEIKLKDAFDLSDREVEIALMLYEGFTNNQIANALSLGEGTCRNYISAIYLKLLVEGRNDAVNKIRDTLSK